MNRRQGKTEQILNKLVSDYWPFNRLLPQRASEVVSVVRIVELREGEIFHPRPGTGREYLFVIDGQVRAIAGGTLESLVPQSTRKKPMVLRGAPENPILVASADSIICLADGALLDKLVSWDEMVRLASDSDIEMKQRLACVRDSLAFRRMPLECVEAAFRAMRLHNAAKDETVITQGESCDGFYIITSGVAEVWETGLYDEKPHKAAELRVGDAFGSEALLSGKPSSETVRIVEDAALLVLNKTDFEVLVERELVRGVNAQVAKSMLETGHQALDVRYAEEYSESHIPGAKLIPLNRLNERMHELDKAVPYVIYCRTGNRSAVAALKLTQNSFDASSLVGGIAAWPYEQTRSEATEVEAAYGQRNNRLGLA